MESSDPAVGAGMATLTATVNGLTAEATVTVVGEASLAPGTVRWTVAPTPGLEMRSPVYPHRVDETVPDLWAVETNELFPTTSRVQALGADGTTRWTEVVPGLPAYGDSFGGLVTRLRDEFTNLGGLARVAAPTGAPPWRYESAFHLDTSAQAPDGTIYAIESVPSVPPDRVMVMDKFVLVIDGQTGVVRTRIPLPRTFSTTSVAAVRDGCNGRDHVLAGEVGPSVAGVVVGADGAGYLQVRSGVLATLANCYRDYEDGVPVDRTDTTFIADERIALELWRVAPTGAVTRATLFAHEFSGNPETCRWVGGVFNPVVQQTGLVPDSLDGLLVQWTRVEAGFGCDGVEQLVTRIDAAGGRTDHVLTSGEPSQILLTGDAGTAFVADADRTTLSAVDVTTWTTKWAVPYATPVMGLAGSGVVLQDFRFDQLSVLDQDGTEVESTNMMLADPSPHVALGLWTGLFDSTLAAVIGSALRESMRSYFADGGNAQRQHAERLTYANAESAAIASMEYVYAEMKSTPWEFGGLVCRLPSGRYQYSLKPTDRLGDRILLPDLLCAGLPVAAEFHTHPFSLGQPFPSGFEPGTYTTESDMYRADTAQDSRVFYLVAPHDMPPPATHILKYCKADSTSAIYNTYERSGTGWVKIPYPPRRRPWPVAPDNCIPK